MACSKSTSSAPVNPRAVFATTHWSVVLTAASNDTTRSQMAMARLCQTYWYPLYAYVRRRGHSAQDAQDLTQSFFLYLLEQRWVGRADPERGRFRSFILATINHFLANEWKKGMAQKRGGDCQHLSLDWAVAEQRFYLEPAAQVAPDKLFDKQWALSLLSGVIDRLEHEYQSDGRADLFAALKQTLLGLRDSQPYAELALALDLNESAVKVAVHRLRKRYRKLICAEIAHTLDNPQEIEAEMRHLFQVLAD